MHNLNGFQDKESKNLCEKKEMNQKLKTQNLYLSSFVCEKEREREKKFWTISKKVID